MTGKEQAVVTPNHKGNELRKKAVKRQVVPERSLLGAFGGFRIYLKPDRVAPERKFV